MTSENRDYFATITDIPELIPDIGDIISDYTGGRCDVETASGTTCWYYNKNAKDNCDRYCLEMHNLNAWLLPMIQNLASSSVNILIQEKENTENIFQTTLHNVNSAQLILQFYHHPFVNTILLSNGVLQIANSPKLCQILPTIYELPQGITGNFTRDYYLYFSKSSLAWIYEHIIVPALKYALQSIESDFQIFATYTIDNNYEMSQADFNQWRAKVFGNKSIDKFNFGIDHLIPLGYIQLYYNTDYYSDDIYIHYPTLIRLTSTSKFYL